MIIVMDLWAVFVQLVAYGIFLSMLVFAANH